MQDNEYMNSAIEKLKYLDRTTAYEKSLENFFLLHNNQIIGYAKLEISPRNKDEVRLDGYNIAEGHQNKGLGKFLLNQHFQWIKEHPEIKKVDISSFTRDGKNYLVRQLRKIQEIMPHLEIFVGDL